jgi:hypothetical protein
LRQLSRCSYWVLLCYFCLVQLVAPLVHAHSISDQSHAPTGLHYSHPSSTTPVVASVAITASDNTDISVLDTGLRPSDQSTLASATLSIAAVNIPDKIKTSFIDTILLRLFYYAYTPRSPPTC